VREVLRISIYSHVRGMLDCPCLNKVVVALTLTAESLAYKRGVKSKNKVKGIL